MNFCKAGPMVVVGHWTTFSTPSGFEKCNAITVHDGRQLENIKLFFMKRTKYFVQKGQNIDNIF